MSKKIHDRVVSTVGETLSATARTGPERNLMLAMLLGNGHLDSGEHTGERQIQHRDLSYQGVSIKIYYFTARPRQRKLTLDSAWDCVASARRGLPFGRKIYLLISSQAVTGTVDSPVSCGARERSWSGTHDNSLGLRRYIPLGVWGNGQGLGCGRMRLNVCTHAVCVCMCV